MRRRRREPPQSPLVGQGFPPGQAAKAVIQVVREINQVHLDYDFRELEAILEEAVRRARIEREERGLK